MDRSNQRALLPHYLAIVAGIAAGLVGLRVTVGDVGIIGNLTVVVVIVLAYPTIVRALGVAPDTWER